MAALVLRYNPANNERALVHRLEITARLTISTCQRPGIYQGFCGFQPLHNCKPFPKNISLKFSTASLIISPFVSIKLSKCLKIQLAVTCLRSFISCLVKCIVSAVSRVVLKPLPRWCVHWHSIKSEIRKLKHTDFMNYVVGKWKLNDKLCAGVVWRVISVQYQTSLESSSVSFGVTVQLMFCRSF